METNLGMDHIRKRPLEEGIDLWKLNVELAGDKPFSMFYIAGFR